MSAVLKAVSDPTRRKVLTLLRGRDMSAGELASHFSLAKATMSKHFAVLKESGLVDVQRNGTTLIYKLNTSVLEGSIVGLMELFQFSRGSAAHENASGKESSSDIV
tara:strand:- start:3964 stop:4281 length:318 start_codon:yes stop_codon:yes gene_type:complete